MVSRKIMLDKHTYCMVYYKYKLNSIYWRSHMLPDFIYGLLLPEVALLAYGLYRLILSKDKKNIFVPLVAVFKKDK